MLATWPPIAKIDAEKTLMKTMNTPFLVIGAGRGGTSLLAASLAGHPDIAMAIELFGWTHLMGLAFAHSDPKAIFAERTRAFREGCLAEIRRHAPRKWGDKLTTEHLFGLEDHNALNPPYQDVIERFFEEVVPEFQIVYIMRDGRACIASKVRRTGQSWEHAAFRWHYAVSVLKTLQKLERPVHLLKFENLVSDPRGQLDEVCRYLGLPFHEAVLQQTASANVLPEYRCSEFDRSKLVIPDVPAHILAFIRSDLEYCGYI